MFGGSDGEVAEMKSLGRSIRLVDGGLEWEGDGRHVQAYLEKLKEFSDSSCV